MAGRGENNKKEFSGGGDPNQSNQGFVSSGESTNRDREFTGGEPSLKQAKPRNTDGDRNVERPKEKIAPLRTDERTLNLVVDDVPYLVKASPFSFNGETRFYVSVNDSPEHVFTWDSELKRLRAIDDNAGVLPESLETAISDKLQSKQR